MMKCPKCNSSKVKQGTYREFIVCEECYEVF